MSNVFKSSASGKIIFAGEYAVLEGAPSIVLATHHQVHVEFHLDHERAQEILFECRGEVDVSAEAVIQGGELHFKREFSHRAFLERLFGHLLQDDVYAAALAQGWRIVIDTVPFFEQEYKIGIGSSSAIVVALIKTLEQVIQRDLSNIELWSIMHEAHSHAQGKKGSGADIATALLNQTCLFKNKNDEFILSPLHLPKDLHVAFFWTGERASTPALLKRLDAWRDKNPECYADIMGDLTTAMQDVIECLEDERVLEALEHFVLTLRALDEQAAIGIFSKEHEALWKRSQEYSDITYKPCGAGGGDLGMAVSFNKDSILDFINQAHSLSVKPISIDVA